jgi:hypothetical protein
MYLLKNKFNVLKNIFNVCILLLKLLILFDIF